MHTTPVVLGLIAALSLAPLPVSAHAGGPVNPGQAWRTWTLDPFIILPVLVILALYVRGISRVWRRAGRGRGISAWRAGAFVAALLTLLIALVSPMDAAADDLLSMHMVQHLILILVCAPLFVLAKPLPALLWALPAELRASIGRTWHRQHWIVRCWSAITQPAAAVTIFSLIFLTWHLPSLYQAAIRNDVVHALEHLSFLAIGVIFWWAVIQPNRRLRRPVGSAMALLGVAMMEGSVLGALMTFSSTVWYPVYEPLTRAWGLSALEDQQLAGLIMWIPAGSIYIAIALGILGSWFHEGDREEERLVYPLVASQRAASERNIAQL